MINLVSGYEINLKWSNNNGHDCKKYSEISFAGYFNMRFDILILSCF